MNDPVRDLYSSHRYPDLSHPATDPAVLAVSARAAGLLLLPPPEQARVVEFGCAAGQNLLPLVARYPQSEFLGLDFSDTAVRSARQAARAAGLENIRFETADLAEWQPEQGCDYLIAHGVLSWVADPVKARVLELCGRMLTESGVACISYNTLPGWSLRRDVAPLMKALANHPTAGLGGSVEEVAASVARMCGSGAGYAGHLHVACRDLVRKGGGVLPFDDLAPVCDPLYFAQVASRAGERGLRYLAESRLCDDLPEGLPPDALAALGGLVADPVMLQQTLDLLSGRTHRVSLFCRADAPMEARTSTAVVLEFSAGRGAVELPAAESRVVEIFRSEISEAAPSRLAMQVLLERTAARVGAGWEPLRHSQEIAGWVHQAARLGAVELRADAVEIARESLERPRLSALNLHFAGQGRPVVDAWHGSCRFPAGHERLLAAMDGSRTADELAAMARADFPELDFPRWLEFLADRGVVG